MIELDGPLVLIGAGNMGGAMLAGWLDRGLPPAAIVIQEPSPPPAVADIATRHGIRLAAKLAALDRPPAVLLMAVKPQIMDQVMVEAARLAGPHTLLLSIAAGKTIASFERHLVPGSAVVRTIPNTPAAIGRGITVAVANAHVTPRQRRTVDALLSAVGEVAWVEDEALIDPVTAVSGSGPAYVFLLAEALAAAGEKAGLSPELAARLARATVAGSGELLHRSTSDAATLRRNVTSPNGTTAAALAVLMADPGLQDLMTRAIAAATKRSRELAG